jgi:hypothetical protein
VPAEHYILWHKNEKVYVRADFLAHLTHQQNDELELVNEKSPLRYFPLPT